LNEAEPKRFYHERESETEVTEDHPALEDESESRKCKIEKGKKQETHKKKKFDSRALSPERSWLNVAVNSRHRSGSNFGGRNRSKEGTPRNSRSGGVEKHKGGASIEWMRSGRSNQLKPPEVLGKMPFRYWKKGHWVGFEACGGGENRGITRRCLKKRPNRVCRNRLTRKGRGFLGEVSAGTGAMS